MTDPRDLRPALVMDLLRSLGGPTPAPAREQFLARRYPYTYAAEFVRDNVPSDLTLAGAAAVRSRFWRDRENVITVTDEGLARMLADCYLRENNVQGIPRDLHNPQEA
jgi:hypothetical protein